MMITIWNWMAANPALVMALWPLFTGVVNLLARKIDAMALDEMNPRMAAMLQLSRAAGFHTTFVLKAVWQLLVGKVPTLPAEPPKEANGSIPPTSSDSTADPTQPQ